MAASESVSKSLPQREMLTRKICLYTGRTKEGREARLSLQAAPSGSQSGVPGRAVSIRTTWQLQVKMNGPHLDLLSQKLRGLELSNLCF